MRENIEQAKSNLPLYLHDFVDSRPSSKQKLLTAWDGLSLETQIQLIYFFMQTHGYIFTGLKNKILDSDKLNDYIFYLTAVDPYSYGCDIDKGLSKIRNDQNPLIKFSLELNSFRGIDNPSDFLSLSQEERIAFTNHSHCNCGDAFYFADVLTFTLEKEIEAWNFVRNKKAELLNAIMAEQPPKELQYFSWIGFPIRNLQEYLVSGATSIDDLQDKLAREMDHNLAEIAHEYLLQLSKEYTKENREHRDWESRNSFDDFKVLFAVVTKFSKNEKLGDSIARYLPIYERELPSEHDTEENKAELEKILFNIPEQHLLEFLERKDIKLQYVRKKVFFNTNFSSTLHSAAASIYLDITVPDDLTLIKNSDSWIHKRLLRAIKSKYPFYSWVTREIVFDNNFNICTLEDFIGETEDVDNQANLHKELLKTNKKIDAIYKRLFWGLFFTAAFIIGVLYK